MRSDATNVTGYVTRDVFSAPKCVRYHPPPPPPKKKKLFRGATAPLRRLCVRMRVQDCCVGLGEVVTVELKSNVKLRYMLSTSIITVIIYTITIGCCEKLIPGCFRKFGPGFGFRFYYLLVSGSHYYSKVSIEHKLFSFR